MKKSNWKKENYKLQNNDNHKLQWPCACDYKTIGTALKSKELPPQQKWFSMTTDTKNI